MVVVVLTPSSQWKPLLSRRLLWSGIQSSLSVTSYSMIIVTNQTSNPTTTDFQLSLLSPKHPFFCDTHSLRVSSTPPHWYPFFPPTQYWGMWYLYSPATLLRLTTISQVISLFSSLMFSVYFYQMSRKDHFLTFVLCQVDCVSPSSNSTSQGFPDPSVLTLLHLHFHRFLPPFLWEPREFLNFSSFP